MIAKLSKILFEVIFLIIGLCIAVLIVSFSFSKVGTSLKYDTFSGTVNKKALVITSPSFATINKLDVYEGELVKQGDELASLKIINEPNSQSISQTLISDETYKVSKDQQTITVYAPSDSIIGKVSYAEKSSVRSQLEIMTLYPLTSSSILIDDTTRTFNIANYSGVFVQKQDDTKNNYPVNVLKTFPVDSQKDGGTTLYGVFVKTEDSSLFDNGENVVILATKKSNNSNLISSLQHVIMSTYSKYKIIITK